MSEKKIRMATGDNPLKQGHTIVGGRPSGNRNLGKDIPRGLEILMMRAAVDPAFLETLVGKRDALAEELQIPLVAAEREMLRIVPDSQLREMASRTPVDEKHRKALSGGSAAAMVALLAQLTFAPVAGRADPADAAQGVTKTGELLDRGSIRLAQAPGDPITPVGGGARPDSPGQVGDELATGTTPGWDIMPPGGARSDEPIDRRKRMPDPNVEGGIRSEVPPDSPVLIPPPVSPDVPLTPKKPPEGPLSLESLRDTVLGTEVNGMPFEKAIQAVEEDTGLKITVQAIQGADLGVKVETRSNGIPLGKVLRRMCSEVAGSEGLFELQIEGREIILRIKSVAGGRPEVQPVIEPPTTVEPPKPDVMTRGIRPDRPLGGIRP